MNMKNAIKTIGKAIADNRSNIVTALVATGVISTTIRAIKDTPKVNLMVDEAVAEKGEDLTKKEKAVIYAKGYWKTIAIGTGTLVLLVGNRVLDQKSMTGLVGAYVAAEGKIQSIKESIKETVEEGKIQSIKESIKETVEGDKIIKVLDVKVAMLMEIEAGTWTEITRTLEHHIDYIIDFDSNPEIKSVSDVVSKPLNGDKDTLVSEIAVTMNFVIDTGFYEKFRGYIGHHIDYIFSLDEYPEIKSIYGCKILDHKVI